MYCYFASSYLCGQAIKIREGTAIVSVATVVQ